MSGSGEGLGWATDRGYSTVTSPLPRNSLSYLTIRQVLILGNFLDQILAKVTDGKVY